MQRIEKKVKEIVAEQLGIEESVITNESTFDDLGADSLDTIELVFALEEEYSIDIPDEDAVDIETVQQAIDYIVGHAI